MANDAPNFAKLVLFSTLSTTILCAVYVHYDAYKLKNDLQSKVQTLIHDLISDSPNSEVDATATITATRKYILFGQPQGKITVYLRNNQMEDDSIMAKSTEDDTESHEQKYSGVEYIFQKEEKEWLNTESGICAESMCQINAQNAFASTGD